MQRCVVIACVRKFQHFFLGATLDMSDGSYMQ